VPVIAYIANCFPSSVEPYLSDEIRELRRRGAHVIACSAKLPEAKSSQNVDICLRHVRIGEAISAIRLLLRNIRELADVWQRVLFRGPESLSRRLRCLAHTFLGAYFAVRLRGYDVDHIHAHHGYFSSWIALVAARLLGAGYSLTLHGSDLLIHAAFLDTKLQNCDFCLTISDFNRQYLLKKYPTIASGKVIMQRMGVDAVAKTVDTPAPLPSSCMVLLSVGRLHEVKNHEFLIEACARLRDRGVDVFCLIAGEGQSRSQLEKQIIKLNLGQRVTLLGHVPRQQLDLIYELADVVVLTSRSEGIPLVLMEAMMRTKLVLAPDITGIPELVVHGETGFLYTPGSFEDFIHTVEQLRQELPHLDGVRRAARAHAFQYFNRQANLDQFAKMFLQSIQHRQPTYAHSFLQQI
jgi:colanic acid/amylovoran biosynthesis glycosyltransferase